MAISDTERREVAARLRALDVHEWYDSADEVDSLETAIGCSIGQGWQDQAWWERLADLIERPTCHNASGHQDACAKKPKARKRAIYLVTDFGGEWEDAWEWPVIAFTDKAAAEECARVRSERANRTDAYWDYCGTLVKEIPLVDFGYNRPCICREEAAHVER